MTNTKRTKQSFILSDAPAVSSSCVNCGAPIKHSLSDTDQPVVLEFNYKPRTIYFYSGGHCFEEIGRSYLHFCPSSVATERDGIGRAADRQLALQ